MVDKDDIQRRVIEAVAQVLNIEINRVTPESDFVKDLGAESIQSIELVATFEEEFDIEMDNDEALEVQTVGAAVDFIAECMEARE